MMNIRDYPADGEDEYSEEEEELSPQTNDGYKIDSYIGEDDNHPSDEDLDEDESRRKKDWKFNTNYRDMFNNCVGGRGRGDSLERQARGAIDESYKPQPEDEENDEEADRNYRNKP